MRWEISWQARGLSLLLMSMDGIPGFDGFIEDVDHSVHLIREIGCPVSVKALLAVVGGRE